MGVWHRICFDDASPTARVNPDGSHCHDLQFPDEGMGAACFGDIGSMFDFAAELAAGATAAGDDPTKGAPQSREVPNAESAQAQANSTGKPVTDSAGVVHLPGITLTASLPSGAGSSSSGGASSSGGVEDFARGAAGDAMGQGAGIGLALAGVGGALLLGALVKRKGTKGRRRRRSRR